MSAGGLSIAPLIDRDRELEAIRHFHEQRVAAVPADALDPEALTTLDASHRREE